VEQLRADVNRLLRAVWGDDRDGDPSGLVADVNRLNASVRVVAAGNNTLHEQIAELTVANHEAKAARAAQSSRLDHIESELQRNTTETRETRAMVGQTLEAAKDIRDIVTTARTGGRLVRWAAPTLAAAAATWATLKGWWPWHKP
jgi:hypothetical protein